MSTVFRAPEVRPTRVLEDPSRSSTLPGWAYTDEDIFKREQHAIFAKSWLYVGSIHDVQKPGDFFTAKILNESLIIIRGQDGALRAFYNVCQHRAHQLLTGSGHVGAIVCPYHSWSYATNGGLRAAPGCEQLGDFSKVNFGLRPVRLETFADQFIFCNLDPAATSLKEQTGGLEQELRTELPAFSDLRPVHSEAKSHYMSHVEANWKVVIDNYVECYHCSTSHPAFCDLLDMANYQTTAHGNWSVQKGRLKAESNRAYAVAPGSASQRSLFYWLWPSITFNVVPGDPAVMFILQWQPTSVGTSATFSQFFSPGGTPCDQARLDYLDHVLGPEDVSLCESVQRGLSSRGYDAGRIMHEPSGSQRTEVGVHAFHRLVVQSLGI
jgi:carnitine monooxygenase subunit